MKFKSKFGETMLWIESQQRMVMFKQGVADVDDNTAKEMKEMGYIEDSTKTSGKVKVEKEEKPVEPKTKSEVQPIKPMKPAKKVESDDSEINSEI